MDNECIKITHEFKPAIYIPKKIRQIFEKCEECINKTMIDTKYITGGRYGGNGGDLWVEALEIDNNFFLWELGSDGHLFEFKIMCDNQLYNDKEFTQKNKLIKNKIMFIIDNETK